MLQQNISTTSNEEPIVKKIIPPPRPGEMPQKKPRQPRKKITIESHLAKHETLLAFIDKEIDKRAKERGKGTKIFRSLRKLSRELYREVPKIAKTRRKSVGGQKVSGFKLKCEITKELADFMQLPHDSTPLRTEITNAICVYAHINPDEDRSHVLKWMHLNSEGKRNLQNPEDKMTIIPDDTLKKLLGYEKYQQDVKDGLITRKKTDKNTNEKEIITVEDDALHYWVIQRLIQHQIIRTIKIDKSQSSGPTPQ
uniref:SWIB/MDM2 domain-containing protein n=1 Tax=Marseillevirus LCMAC102 TaxID=2506603 RepID=A0A481YUH8_9VIRU|nr:MAG: SWIB/MDM2 domain-containing protein [Marseillevirus LCMAC102]